MNQKHELALLEALHDAGGYAMRKKSLYADVHLRLSRHEAITIADFDALLRTAQEKNRILATRGEDDMMITITPDGTLRIAALRG